MERRRIVSTTRRAFVGLAAGLAVGWPFAAQTQPPGGVRRLGVLTGSRADDPAFQANEAALLKDLAAQGWKDGGNLHVEWRYGAGDPALYAPYAAELVALRPDVILAVGSPAVAALRPRAGPIPIVFTIVTDPVGQGIVASLARPGGTITGLTDFDPPMAGKWLGMLTHISPPAARVAALYNPATSPFAAPMLRIVEEAAPSLRLKVHAAVCHDAAEIERVIAELAREQRGGLLILPDFYTLFNRGLIIAAAARHRVPAVYWNRTFADDGGLMAYGVDNVDLYRRAADYIDRILKGAKPSDLPVQNPTKFDLVINLKTAASLGITIASSLLAGANAVIE